MLNPEAAQAQLKLIVSKDWRSHRLRQFAALPKNLASIGYGLFSLGEDGTAGDYSQVYLYQAQALERLSTLSEGDHQQLFAILFPKFSAVVELAWQFHSQLPYQQGYSRMALT